MSHTRAFQIAAALLLICATACAVKPASHVVTDTATISGVVMLDGAPLPGATVRVDDIPNRLAVTAADGTFAIGGLPQKTYNVEVSGPGLRTLRTTATAASRSRRPLQIHMHYASMSEEITVTAAAPAVSRSTTQSSMVIGRGYAPMYLPRAESDWNTEEYAAIEESGFRLARTSPLSTFSIDVDTASYSNVRRMLENGQLPPRDAVRIEELLNYFTYDYPEPGREPFAVTTEIAEAPWNPSHRLITIGVQGRRINTSDLPPNNLTFLIDVSGSMQSPDKLPLLVSSLRLLVDAMRPQDRVAVVVYAGSEGLLLPPTSGEDKGLILARLGSLEAGGSTAGAAGLRLAYQTARRSYDPRANNRVILATDGDFNVGVSSEGELAQLIESERDNGIFLSVLGFGTGNIKDNKMETLADKGNGNYAYIDSVQEARKVLVREMGATLLTIAKDVKIQVEFNPAKVGAYRLIGYENRMLATEDFNDDRKDAGELGAGHSVTALYEIVPAGREHDLVSSDQLRYQTTQMSETAFGDEIMQLKLRYKDPQGTRSRLIERTVMDRNQSVYAASDDFRFAAAVAGFGMLLRDSEHKGATSYDKVLALADSARGVDLEGYRAGFVDLVHQAQRLDRQAARMGN